MSQQILGTDVQLGSIITVNGVPQVVTAIQGNTITSVPVPGPVPTSAVTATSGNVKAVNGLDSVPNIQFADGTILNTAGTGGPIGGTTGQLQYNNAGAFGGFADGTAHQVLHGGRTFSAVDLAADVTGALPIANGGSGAATAAAKTVFANPTTGVAAPAFTAAPLVDSVVLAAVAPTAGAGQVALGATHQTTVGAAGAASALPAAPTGYLIINVAGTAMVIPYYAQA